MDQTATLEALTNVLTGRFQQHGMANAQIKNNHHLKINGRNAYESELYGEINGQKLACYACLMEVDGRAVGVECVAKKDIEANVQEFKKFVRSLQIK